MSFFRSQHVVVSFYDLESYMKKNKCILIEQNRKYKKKYVIYEIGNIEVDLSPMLTNFKWVKKEGKIIFYKKK